MMDCLHIVQSCARRSSWKKEGKERLLVDYVNVKFIWDVWPLQTIWQPFPTKDKFQFYPMKTPQNYSESGFQMTYEKAQYM